MNVRRKLLLSIGAGAFLHSSAVRAMDAAKSPRIGYVGGSAIERGRSFTIFRDELQRVGFIDGKTVVIEYRAAEGDLERIPGLVQELVDSKVDVLVALNIVTIRAAQRATTTIPIVMATSLDPLAAGFAQSLRQLGGNITGIYTLRQELSAKRIELVSELIPGISRLAILWDVDGPGPKQRFHPAVLNESSCVRHGARVLALPFTLFPQAPPMVCILEVNLKTGTALGITIPHTSVGYRTDPAVGSRDTAHGTADFAA